MVQIFTDIFVGSSPFLEASQASELEDNNLARN